MVILVIFRISPKIQSSLLSWILCKDQATALDACIKKNHTTAAQEELKLTCLVILHCDCKVKIWVQLPCEFVDRLGREDLFWCIAKVHVAICDFHESHLKIFEGFTKVPLHLSLTRTQVSKFRRCEVMPN